MFGLNMSEKREKLPSQIPKDQGDISDKQSKPPK